MPEKTKLEEEYDSLKSGLRDIKDEIDSQAPHWLIAGLSGILSDQRTAYFFCGAATEAFTIWIQFQFFGGAYPILDAVVGFPIFFALLWFGPKMRVKSKPIAVDEEGEDEEV